MFWSTLGQKPSIYRSHMDGGELVELDNIIVAFPTGIAIDYQHDSRYDIRGLNIVCINCLKLVLKGT